MSGAVAIKRQAKFVLFAPLLYICTKYGGIMDYRYALNYWRKTLTSMHGDPEKLDELIDEIGDDSNALLAFRAMLQAAARGEFGKPER